VIIPTSFIVQSGPPNNNQNTTHPNADDLLGWLKKGVERSKQQKKIERKSKMIMIELKKKM
jgi:hypothetical protein